MKPTRELIERGGDEALLYACGECGHCYSPKIYGGGGVGHQTARRAADECCQPRHCACGAEIGKSWTACTPCRERRAVERAARVELDDANPVYSYEVDGDWGEGFSSDIDALREYCEDYDIAVPAYVHPCTPQRFSIDSDHIVESALEDFHEDAGDQIIEEDDLHSFIRTWNAKQTLTTWFPDISRVVVLDEDRFAALLDHPHERGQTAAAGDNRNPRLTHQN